MALRDDLLITRPVQQVPARGAGRGWRVAGYLAMALTVLVIGLPVYWVFIAAFKENREIYSIPPTWFPQQLTLENFPQAWNAGREVETLVNDRPLSPFGQYYLNSFITTGLGVAAEVVLAVLSAYALAFVRFPRKQLVFLLLLAALMVPVEITIVPNYLTVARLGWINSYAGIIIPGAAIAYGTFLLRQAFLALPYEVIEAARVDGAGHLRILRSVVIPIAQPSIVTMALLSLVAKWNDFLWPLIVTNTLEMRTLPIGIYWLRNSEGVQNWGVVMAGSLFLIIPVMIVFLWVQRYIVEGIAAGAVKG